MFASRYIPPAIFAISALLMPPRVTAQQSCEVQWVPEELPSLNAVIDSVALMAAPFHELVSDEQGTVLLTLRFARQIVGRRVDVVGTDIEPLLALAVRDFVSEIIVDESPLEPWGVRLRIILGHPINVALQEAGYCPPSVIQRSPMGTRSIEFPTPDDMRDIERAGRVRVRVEVSPYGQVLDAELTLRSGSRVQNERVQRDALEILYTPAMLDGVAVQSVYEYPVTWRIGPRDS